MNDQYMTPNLVTQNSALSQAKERESIGLSYKIKVKNSTNRQDNFVITT